MHRAHLEPSAIADAWPRRRPSPGSHALRTSTVSGSMGGMSHRRARMLPSAPAPLPNRYRAAPGTDARFAGTGTLGEHAESYLESFPGESRFGLSLEKGAACLRAEITRDALELGNPSVPFRTDSWDPRSPCSVYPARPEAVQPVRPVRELTACQHLNMYCSIAGTRCSRGRARIPLPPPAEPVEPARCQLTYSTSSTSACELMQFVQGSRPRAPSHARSRSAWWARTLRGRWPHRRPPAFPTPRPGAERARARPAR